jgi:hypothetical protein
MYQVLLTAVSKCNEIQLFVPCVNNVPIGQLSNAEPTFGTTEIAELVRPSPFTCKIDPIPDGRQENQFWHQVPCCPGSSERNSVYKMR